MSDGRSIGRWLAERHASGGAVEIDREVSLLNYAELPRTGDWSLRSALTRLAQPHPQIAAEVLELVRRCDYALSTLRREFESAPVVADRSLGRVSQDTSDLYPDGRAADLARLVRATPHQADALIAGYEESADALSDGERAALPLLVGALAIDDLADALATWASHGHADPPVTLVADVVGRVGAYFEQIGVPLDTGPPWPGRRG